MQLKKNKFIIWLVALLLSATSQLSAQDASLIVLGDMHLDKFEWHDMNYVYTRPQDFAQISKEYPFYTATYMPHLLKLIKKKTEQDTPPVKAILQLGDLMQGVSGNKPLALTMGNSCTGMLADMQLSVPWILTKGNHDVSNSPGQPEAWRETILPFISKQIKKPINNGMYTYKVNEKIQLFVLEQFFSDDEKLAETAIIDFLSEELPKSNAKYKLLLTHQPVIPVTEKCWHLFSGIRRPLSDLKIRDSFLELLAEHHVIVLCAHLHKYSKLVRQTPKGIVVQFMFNSVINNLQHTPQMRSTSNFPSEPDIDKSWQTHTLAKRLNILNEEKKFITSFYKEDSSGYGMITLKEDLLSVCYYRGLDTRPSDSTIIESLYR